MKLTQEYASDFRTFKEANELKIHLSRWARENGFVPVAYVLRESSRPGNLGAVVVWCSCEYHP